MLIFYNTVLNFLIIQFYDMQLHNMMFFASTNYLKMQRHFQKVAAGNSSFLHVSPA